MSTAFRDHETMLLRQMTVEQKLLALDALRRTAHALVETGVRMRHPDWSPAAVRREALQVLARDRA